MVFKNIWKGSKDNLVQFDKNIPSDEFLFSLCDYANRCLNTIKHLDNIFRGHENFSDKIFIQNNLHRSWISSVIWERPGHQLHGHHHFRVDDALRLQPGLSCGCGDDHLDDYAHELHHHHRRGGDEQIYHLVDFDRIRVQVN